MIPASYFFKDLYRREFVDPPIEPATPEALGAHVSRADDAVSVVEIGVVVIGQLAALARRLAPAVRPAEYDSARVPAGLRRASPPYAGTQAIALREPGHAERGAGRAEARQRQ